jgi:hypothetical protein
MTLVYDLLTSKGAKISTIELHTSTSIKESSIRKITVLTHGLSATTKTGALQTQMHFTLTEQTLTILGSCFFHQEYFQKNNATENSL